MRTFTKHAPSLSTTAKTALAIWLAQSPPAPGCATPDSAVICARLARSAKRSGDLRRPPRIIAG